MPYSLYEVVQDHIVTCPRWLHHVLIKMGLHAMLTFYLLVIFKLLSYAGVGVPILWAGLAAGPGLYACIKIPEELRIWRLETIPLWPRLADILTDLSDASFPMGGCAILAGYPIAGAAVMLLSLATWALCHRDSRP